MTFFRCVSLSKCSHSSPVEIASFLLNPVCWASVVDVEFLKLSRMLDCHMIVLMWSDWSLLANQHLCSVLILADHRDLLVTLSGWKVYGGLSFFYFSLRFLFVFFYKLFFKILFGLFCKIMLLKSGDPLAFNFLWILYSILELPVIVTVD